MGWSLDVFECASDLKNAFIRISLDALFWLYSEKRFERDGFYPERVLTRVPAEKPFVVVLLFASQVPQFSIGLRVVMC